MSKTPHLLSSLSLPRDIAGLSALDKETLAQEVRAVIIQTIARNGGHLAPSLGVVELTIALLTAFNPPEDSIVWDVGHQSYPWKLLTGRAPAFGSIRQENGLSGFPKRSESVYDAFGVGHASTSISAALGMAVARDLNGEKGHVVAIIGDGALGGGMAFEALNQAGGLGKRLIVILNDNKMAISENVGALSLFLSRNLSTTWVMHLKRSVGDILLSIPRVGRWLLETVQRGEYSFKSFFTPGMLFEAFRFNYIGPVNGHDIGQLIKHLEMAKQLDQPVLLHVRTRKGKGYRPAELDPTRFHGVTGFEPDSGLFTPHSMEPKPSNGGYTKVFERTLCELGAADPRIVAVTAAMPEGTGTKGFQERFPDRFIDVGICEEHAVTFAAGLAARGLRPVVAIYSTFLQRAYDQIIHDVCLQNLPVVFCVDRAGLVGEDGPTHHGAFDLTFLRAVPNLLIFSPRDEQELRDGLFTALQQNAPVALRYPRSPSGRPCKADLPLTYLQPGLGEILLRSQSLENADSANGSVETMLSSPSPAPHSPENNICVLAIGSMVWPSVEAAATLPGQVTVFDVRWLKPLPVEQILALAHCHKKFLVVEENTAQGGLAAAVLESLAAHKLLNQITLRHLSLPDAFVPHGKAPNLRAHLSLDAPGIARALRQLAEE